MTLRAVIVSTGRAGSGYIARLATQAGIPASHEIAYSIDGNLGPAADRIVESSWLALPHLEADPDRLHVLHQVRHPLAVVSSLCNGHITRKPDQRYRRFREDHTDRPAPAWNDPMEAWVHWFSRHVVDWTLRADKIALLTWRVEDVDETIIRRIGDAAGALPLNEDRIARALEQVPPTTNKHRDGPALDWDDVPGELVELGERYGYR